MALIEGLQLPFGIQPINPLPVNSWEGPYNSIAEALSSIPIDVRYPTMDNIKILDPSGNKIYWFKDGVQDSDLVLFGIDSSFLSGETAERKAADIVLNNMITGETSERIIQDNILLGGITGLTNTVVDNYNTLFNQLTGETFDRIIGDSLLQSEITGLAQTVNNNYSDLQNQITTGFTNVNNEISGLTTIVKTKLDITGITSVDNSIIINVSGNTVDLKTQVVDLTPYATKEYVTGLTNDLNSDLIYLGLIVDNNYNLLTGETYNREQQDIIFANEISGLTGLSHQQNTDFQLLNNGHIVSLDAGGTLHIENISQVGSGYTTHSEQVYTTKNEIILRDGAVSGLAPGEFAGIRAKLYDGVNDGVLEFDSSGVARVGDVGSTQAIATMEDNPVNNGFAYWDGATFKFNTKVLTSNDVSGLTTSLGGYLTISGATNTYATINSLTGETFNRINQDNILQTNINNKFDLTGGTINGNLNIYSGYTISGNGSGLNNIPASGITGLQLDRISSGSNSAIMSSSGLTINTGMTVGGNLKVNSTSGTTLFQVTEASSNYLMEITDVDGNDIITVSENEGDTLLDVIETGGSTVFSVGNDGSIKQNSVTRTGVTSTLSPYGVINISKFSCSSVFFDYVIKETGSNAYRCGTVMCVQDGTNVSYTETSKTDLNASTSGLTFSTQIVGSFIVLVATITSGTWNIYVGARKL